MIGDPRECFWGGQTPQGQKESWVDKSMTGGTEEKWLAAKAMWLKKKELSWVVKVDDGAKERGALEA